MCEAQRKEPGPPKPQEGTAGGGWMGIDLVNLASSNLGPSGTVTFVLNKEIESGELRGLPETWGRLSGSLWGFF